MEIDVQVKHCLHVLHGSAHLIPYLAILEKGPL